jgi:hypothetical protein
MLLLQCGLLCVGLASYKAHLVNRDDFATSFNFSYPEDDGDMLEESDLYSLYSQSDNKKFEDLLKQFKRSKSRDSLEGSENIPTSNISHGMENRTQGSNPTWYDNVLNSIIHHQVFMVILLILLLICIAVALCCVCRCLARCIAARSCWVCIAVALCCVCRCLARCCSFTYDFCLLRRLKCNHKEYATTNLREDLVEGGAGNGHETTVFLTEV